MSTKSLSMQAFKKNTSSMDQAAATAKLNSLREAIDQIYNRNASSLKFEELYRYAYNMVLSKHGNLLYDGICGIIEDHLYISLAEIISSENENMLNSLVDVWNSHKIAFNSIKDILMYMDRSFVVQRKKVPIYNCALQLFREIIARNPEVNEKLRTILLENIQLERRGCVIDRTSMKTVLSMLVDLGIDGDNIYKKDFEVFFLEETKKFYQVESLEFLSQNSCPDYLKKVEIRLSKEALRVHNYLHSSSESTLKHVVEYELIAVHAKVLIEMEQSGFFALLNDLNMDYLRLMFSLFSRIPSSVELLRDYFHQYIVNCGLDIVSSQNSSKDPINFVKKILQLKTKCDVVIAQSFGEDKGASKKLKSAFEDFINRDHNCASYLASYCDDLLKNGAQDCTEMEVEEKLQRVIVIFKFISDKDIFENFYKNLLCKRLLSARVGSDELEKLMISKLKAECGYQFTSKLEGMFLDINISKTVAEEYKQTVESQQTSENVELDISMLTAGYWPLQIPAVDTCNLPAPLHEKTGSFTAFYLDKHSGRRLSWLTNLGSVDLKATFDSGRKELSVSTYQACIIMLFNSNDILSLEHIRAATSIPELELRRHLLSLCTPKLRLLKKSSKGKGIELDDVFTYNKDFSSKLKRIRAPLISPKEIQPLPNDPFLEANAINEGKGAASGDSGVPASVEEDRRHLVEAAVVRIMKARKNLSHNELVAEVTRQISARFTPTPQFIKKRVESLMEREYLQRSKTDAKIYQYLA